jgi:hypothetical protein
MNVSYSDPANTSPLCCVLATQGVFSGGGRKVSQIKTGIESQQAVWNVGVETADVTGYGVHLLVIYIAGDQKGTGDQERGVRPLWHPFAQLLEILQGLFV